MKYPTAVMSIFVVAGMASVPALAANFAGQQKYGAQAKISLQKAEQIALRHAYAGKIISEELEKEKGGSGLRYSFDIRKGNSVHEVGVDARTGMILENSVEKSEPGEEGEDKSGADTD